MLIHFVAIVDAKNYPVYFQSLSTNGDESALAERVKLNQQFVAEMALDFVDAQLNTASTASTGPLLVTDGLAVYGSLTNTNVKVLVAIDASSSRTLDMEQLMGKIQEAYVSFICNPFYDESHPAIESPVFTQRITAIVTRTDATQA